MSSIQLFDLNGEQRFTGTSVGGGGAQPDSATVTTDPNTFTVQHVFDLGAVAVVSVEATATAAVADGETWGASAADIAAAVESLEMSFDNVVWQAIPNLTNAFDAPYAGGALPQLTRRYITYSARYVRATLTIFAGDFSGIYAGPNHPTATFDISVVYR